MFNNNKGITLVALTVTIVILLILASVATYSGVGTVKYIKFNNAKAQFETMQSKAIEWYEESKQSQAKRTAILEYGVPNNHASCDQTKLSATFNGARIEDDDEKARFRFFSSHYIKDTLGVDGISYDFLIDVQNYKVLLFGGIEYEGETYYTAKKFGIERIQAQEMSGNISFERIFKDGYLIVHSITLPTGIRKYNVQYKLSNSPTWITVTSDNKKTSYTDYYGTIYENAWCIPLNKSGIYDVRITTANESISKEQDFLVSQVEFYKEKAIVATKKEKLKDKRNAEMVLPKGFFITRDSADEIKDGIVVEDNEQNQFVWVPVELDENGKASTMYGTTESGIKIGKLYNFTDSGKSNNNWETDTANTIKWTSTTGYREPDLLEDASTGDASTTANRGLNLLKSIVGIEGTVGTDDAQMLAAWKKMLQDEFDEMIEKVEATGGFYVGRYETSINQTTGKAQSKKGEQVSASDAKTWYGLYMLEKTYSNSNVESSMIWGCQYDQMMIWMQNNGYDVRSTTPKNGLSRNMGNDGQSVGTTGTVETDKMNNIYDLLGNGYEWTLEAKTTDRRVLRGEKFGSLLFGPVNRRDVNSITYVRYDYYSSRIVLYIK